MRTSSLSLSRVSWDNPVAAAMRAAQQAELATLAGTDAHEPGPPPAAPDVPIFILAYRIASGEPLGCGGLRRLDEETAEIKRVYVVPFARGSGVSFEILESLERLAGQAGFREIRAEAGTFQLGGRRFYERAGYRQVENFPPYVGSADSLCYAKSLPAPLRAAG